MSKTKKDDKKLPLNADANHPLRSRRDFLAQGLMTGVGSIILPFSTNALAACDLNLTVTENPMIPVIILDLAGGSNIAGSNVIVGKSGGQDNYIADYSSIGLDASRHPSMNGMVNRELGIAFHRDSGILAGIQATTTAATRQRMDGLLFCATSDDDTDNNPHNPMYWFHKAGARGKITQLIGNVNSMSGARSQAPAESVDMTIRPQRISNPQDVTNMIGIGATADGFMGARGGGILMRAIDSLSQSHINSISRRKMNDKIRDVILCNSAKTQGVLSQFTTNQVDPATDALILQNFGTNNSLNNINGDVRTAATVTKMVLDGYAATGTITMGGFDYHTGNRIEGDRKDREVGEIVGRIMQTAAMKNSPVVVYIYTDGGVSANNTPDNAAQGRLSWAGDSGQRSASLMMVYNPAGRPQMRQTTRQIGYYKEGGSNDNNASPASNSVVNLAKAVVLNYLALHGMEGSFEETVGDNPFTNLDSHIHFTRIA